MKLDRSDTLGECPALFERSGYLVVQSVSIVIVTVADRVCRDKTPLAAGIDALFPILEVPVLGSMEDQTLSVDVLAHVFGRFPVAGGVSIAVTADPCTDLDLVPRGLDAKVKKKTCGQGLNV